jgi:predicted MFS family arabinose efflux permease
MEPQLNRFFFSVFLFSIGFGIMTPSVPLFANLKLFANEWELGILGALAATPYVFGPALLGKLSDQVGRKPVIIVGLLIYVVTCIAYTMSTSLYHLALLRILEGVSFSSIWPSAEAYVADSTVAGSRSKAVCHYSIAWSSGYTVGPFLMGTVLAFFDIYSAFIASAAFLACGMLLILLLKTPKNIHEKKETLSDPNTGRGIFYIIYTMIIWGFVTLSFFFLFPAYAGSNAIIPSYIAYLVGIVGLVRTIVFVLYDKVLKTFRSATLPSGMLTLSVAMIIAWAFPSLPGFILSTMFLGLSLGLLYAHSLIYMLNKPAKGLYAGLFESSIGIGELIGPITMGYLGFVVVPSFPYLFLSILGIISFMLMLRAMRGFSQQGP